MAVTKAAARKVLLPLILLVIFFLTEQCCVAGSRLSNALHLHDGDAQMVLHHTTEMMRLKGRKAEAENANSVVGSSGDSQEANVKTSAESKDVDSFASYADYGAPRRHPPKNN